MSHQHHWGHLILNCHYCHYTPRFWYTGAAPGQRHSSWDSLVSMKVQCSDEVPIYQPCGTEYLQLGWLLKTNESSPKAFCSAQCRHAVGYGDTRDRAKWVHDDSTWAQTPSAKRMVPSEVIAGSQLIISKCWDLFENVYWQAWLPQSIICGTGTFSRHEVEEVSWPDNVDFGDVGGQSSKETIFAINDVSREECGDDEVPKIGHMMNQS